MCACLSSSRRHPDVQMLSSLAVCRALAAVVAARMPRSVPARGTAAARAGLTSAGEYASRSAGCGMRQRRRCMRWRSSAARAMLRNSRAPHLALGANVQQVTPRMTRPRPRPRPELPACSGCLPELRRRGPCDDLDASLPPALLQMMGSTDIRRLLRASSAARHRGHSAACPTSSSASASLQLQCRQIVRVCFDGSSCPCEAAAGGAAYCALWHRRCRDARGKQVQRRGPRSALSHARRRGAAARNSTVLLLLRCCLQSRPDSSLLLAERLFVRLRQPFVFRRLLLWAADEDVRDGAEGCRLSLPSSRRRGCCGSGAQLAATCFSLTIRPHLPHTSPRPSIPCSLLAVPRRSNAPRSHTTDIVRTCTTLTESCIRSRYLSGCRRLCSFTIAARLFTHAALALRTRVAVP
jgi:hypothetical protein